MRQIKYSKTLVNFLESFVNRNEKEINTDKYRFTGGVIFLPDALVATDRRFFIKITVEGIPTEFVGKSLLEGNVVSNTIDTMSLQLVTMKPFPNTIECNPNKWEMFYEKAKKYKRPKSFGKSLSPGECVKFNNDFVIKTKDFDRLMKICQKYDLGVFKYNNISCMCGNGQITAISVLQNKSSVEIDEVQKI